MKDLFILVADKNMEYTFNGILERKDSLKIRDITFYVQGHKLRDPGVYKGAHEFLKIYIGQYNYALVVFDREGCGCDDTASEIAYVVQTNLNSNGWENRSKVIVLDPELEIWIWSDSPEVAQCINWDHKELRDWLAQKYLTTDSTKPAKPKEAFEEALRVKKIPRSSSIYRKLAERVSFKRCEDSAFKEFTGTLQQWFPR
ncbi:MAG: hypothetical protein H7844_12785 [Nitrospirae bacterium YQR-1]